MAFSSLASNQMVSEADAATSSFLLQSGQSHGSSNQCMDKTAATTKYSINPSVLSSYASNELIPKSAWQGYVISYRGYYNTLIDACTDGPGAIHYNVWIDTSSLIVGSRLFLDVNLVTVGTGYSVGYYYNATSGEVFQANSSGYITSILSCAPSSHSYNFDTTGYITDLDSCLSAGSGLTLYSADAWITPNVTQLYTDAALTTALNGLNRWWYLGADVATYEIDGSGYVLTQAGC